MRNQCFITIDLFNKNGRVVIKKGKWMNMKKIIVMLLSAGMLLNLSACNDVSEHSSDIKEQQKSVTAEKSEGTLVDYETVPFEKWVYTTEQDGEADQLLNSINNVQYGSAGSSLEEISAAVSMILLSQDDHAIDTIKCYLSEMTDIQRDYFSFSWEAATEKAEDIFDHVENYSEMIKEAGYPDFDITQYSKERLDHLDDMAEDYFTQAGITEEWENHKDILPFSVMLEDD